MKKRFLWTALITLVALVALIPFFNYEYITPHSIEEASNRNFIGLVLLFVLVLFIAVFAVVNTYFNLHPDYQSLIEEHKKQHPSTPDDYYRNAEDKEQDK